MVMYNLSHLIQYDPQIVFGPIQDDEALFLFSLVRVLRLKRILEIGFFKGYSATNFLAAVGKKGTVYSCDINKITALEENHKPISKDVGELTAQDVDGLPLDLVFFDCHSLIAQMKCFHKLKEAGIITDKTILALHDTGTHPGKLHTAVVYTQIGPGEFVHQPVEREMVNMFADMGYSPLCLNMDISRCSEDDLPFRHGLTIMSKFTKLRLS